MAAAGAAFEEPGAPALAGPVRGNTAQGMCGFDSLLSQENYCKKTSLRGEFRVSSLAITHPLSPNHNLPCLPRTLTRLKGL